MTPAEFKRKWSRYRGKETSGYSEHFNDLCALLEHPSPATADPSGSEEFCFQKRVVKDAELFLLREDGSEYAPDEERGFADVWKKGCFAWEYKGKKKNLDEAYRQLLRYRESLLNPPLLIVCDFDRTIIRTNFNGTVQETHEFTLAQLDEPHNLNLLRNAFTNPEFLRPQRTTREVTEQLAAHIGEVARSLQQRTSMELRNARTRSQVEVAQQQNLRIARFLNRLLFCFFAEDVGLLPPKTFSEVTTAGLESPRHFAATLEDLFRAMSAGGRFGAKTIRAFNGHLFEEATVFELTPEEIRALADASEADWQFIEPSILGTLFERALDERQRAKLGAHYTSKEDIEALVEPVLMAPLRAEWTEIKRSLLPAYVRGEGKPADRKRLDAFLKKLGENTVLDPACGSGNFLYVSLQLLLGLEKEVIAFATQLGFKFMPQVGVQQLKAIEINPYAFELAQVAVQIGWLQWRRDNGFPLDRDPVLQTLDGFENKDALLHQTFRRKRKSLKEAREAEHEADKDLKAYTEGSWPECSVIVSNPPFLGDKYMRGELGDRYVTELRKVFDGRVPGQADLCCYWFEKTRQQIEDKKCRRAGLLATQGIRGGANREVLQSIKQTGDIFFAQSDRPWVLDGANVHVSMVGFDEGSQKERVLDGQRVESIHANLTAVADTTQAQALQANQMVAFQGPVRVGDFDVSYEEAVELLSAVNPHGRPNSDVLRPTLNGTDNTKRPRERWVIDFGKMPIESASLYEKPFHWVEKHVKPLRDASRREGRKLRWWQHGETGDAMNLAFGGHGRFLAMAQTAKYFLFRWHPTVTSPEQTLIVFARHEDGFFGLLHSRHHTVWALKQGTRLETRPRYTPTTCFESFPFPEATPAQEAVIAAAARELNELRERWLNPPEWTTEKVLEFPGTVDGPWSRFLQNPNAQGIGTIRYSRQEPKDAECAKKLKECTLTNLYNERPAWLNLAHRKLDEAVAAAYGWPADLPEEPLLEKLLVLNLERSDAEARSGTLKPRASRAKHEDELL